MSKRGNKAEKSSEKNYSDEKIFFEGRMQEIEHDIIQFHIDLAKSNQVSESIEKIIAILLLHGRLTQTQIKKLVNLSKSTISTGLTNLVSIGHLKKEKIKGSREYQYYFSSTFLESQNNAFGSLEKEIDYFKIKLTQLTDNFSSAQKGFNMLTNRLEELISIFELYQKILQKMQNPRLHVENNPIHSKLTKLDLLSIDEIYDPEIKQIEDEIIDFFQYESQYSTLEPLSLVVYVYFLLRKVLTQKKLRELTGLSLGKISQIINSQIEKEMIDKLNKKNYKSIIPADKKRQEIYAINSIRSSFFKSSIKSHDNILLSKQKFEKLRKELKTNASELKKLNGYEIILENVENYFNLLAVFEQAIEVFEEFL
jgi:DNA-binding transcriptional regulator GbsR (MarR family)